MARAAICTFKQAQFAITISFSNSKREKISGGRIVDALAGVLGILFDQVAKFFAGHRREGVWREEVKLSRRM